MAPNGLAEIFAKRAFAKHLSNKEIENRTMKRKTKKSGNVTATVVGFLLGFVTKLIK